MSHIRPFSDFHFQQFLSEGRLMGCKCQSCGTEYLPPKPTCSSCYSQDMEWVEMPITGKLAAFTCIAIAPPVMIKEGYNRKNPYCIGVVELDNGQRIDAIIKGVEPRQPETIHIGMEVLADFHERVRDGIQSTVVAFRQREKPGR